MAFSLPIHEYKEELLDAIHKYETMVIIGDTGSGKTTQLPQYLLETQKYKKIAITQPRRIAAISAAKHVSSQLETILGQGTIGYAIRFDRCCSSDTRLVYMTDGLLLKEFTSKNHHSILDIDLFDVFILDEAHERSLDTDILFGLLKTHQKTRMEYNSSNPESKLPDVKIIVMSATMDVDKFSAFFGDCPVFSIPGRCFEVDIYWQKKTKLSTLKSSFIQRSIQTALEIHKHQPKGDILVFLTGQHEIETACRNFIKEYEQELEETSLKNLIDYYNEVWNVECYPVYSTLETYQQREIFKESPKGTRKIIFATNIAQTSITIPWIRYVVDCGFVKEKIYDPKTSMDALVVVPISQAAATQRAGRAGRTAPGKVYRLYSKYSFEKEMPEDSIPEIQRSSLVSTILSLKKNGIYDILGFNWIDAPDKDLVLAATKQLWMLGALDSKGFLTEIGNLISDFPVSPFLSRSIIESCKESCSNEVLTIAALLSVPDIFVVPFQSRNSYHNNNSSKHDDAVNIWLTLKQEYGGAKRLLGDHMFLLCIYNDFISLTENEKKKWCSDRYLRHSSLKSATTIREQLVQIMNSKKLPILHSPTLQSKSDKKRIKSGYIDSIPILKSLCTGFFIHTAKKYRTYFHSYLHSRITTGDSSKSIPLHTQPTSIIAEYAFENDERCEWVIYHDIQFVNTCRMRYVSMIRFDWVDYLFKRLENELGEFNQSKIDWTEGEDEEDGDLTVKGSLDFEEDHEEIDLMKHKETKKDKREGEGLDQIERVAKINGARERYLARKKHK